MNNEYNASIKINDKWVNFGKISRNQWGNLQLSMRNSAELKQLINGGKEWLNFSLFEAKPKTKNYNNAPSKASKPSKVANIAEDLDDEIPF